ncbi:MAG TPA: DUF6655 family protein [Salinisphaeraceae bacterium]|nr:DUF6655 family protein [Salinisphaeraceae bacterium]
MPKFLKKGVLAGVGLLACIAFVGCVTVRETQPEQTAREQLLLSRAADLASMKIDPTVPAGNAIYVNTRYFIDDDDYRTRYAIARIRAQLLARGYRLVGSRDEADTIAEVSSGALSIDGADTMFGLPSIPIPIPFAESISTPQIPVFRNHERNGTAKFLITFYSAKTGSEQDIVGPIYGFSRYERSSILGISWQQQNLMEPEAE